MRSNSLFINKDFIIGQLQQANQYATHIFNFLNFLLFFFNPVHRDRFHSNYIFCDHIDCYGL